MIQKDFAKIIVKVKRYFKDNGGSPFIVGFMLLFVVSAVFLSAGFSSLADITAVYGYCALVVGVFLQLFYFLKYRRKSEDKVIV